MLWRTSMSRRSSKLIGLYNSVPRNALTLNLVRCTTVAMAISPSSFYPNSTRESAVSASREFIPDLGRGRLIVFEGIDRSGKTTQSKLLAERWEADGRKVKLLRFPDRSSPTGLLLNEHLQKKYSPRPEVLHLLFSANRWEKNDEIERLLQDGYDVVADRYAFSGVAYSSGALGLDRNWCLNPDRGLVAPDVVFYLSLSPSDAQMRSDFGGEFYENNEMQRRVSAAYSTFSELPFWHTIPANQPAERIHNEIYDLLSLAVGRFPPPGRLFDADAAAAATEAKK